MHSPQQKCGLASVSLLEVTFPACASRLSCLNLQTKNKDSFSRLCERAHPSQTQLRFDGQEMQAAWEPDMGQGGPGKTSSFKQGAQRGFATGAERQVKSCSPAAAESKKETQNTVEH